MFLMLWKVRKTKPDFGSVKLLIHKGEKTRISGLLTK